MTDHHATHQGSDTPARALTRRNVLRGLGVGGLALPVLAACGGGSEPSASPGNSDPSSGGSGGEGSGGTGSGGTESGGTSIPVSDVPVGGGTILAAEMVVVTQPEEGDFKAFSARCTHQGCPVQTVEDGLIGCNCHGSRFSIEDGSVASGPAPSPLESLSVSVEGDEVVVG